MKNKSVLIFKNSCYMKKDDLKTVYRELKYQRDDGIILLPPFLSFEGAGNADGTVVIKDADGNVVLWGDDNA